ncbi:MAG: hypothetical protein Q9192_002538 [Flavoplaca navasiana]
MGVWRGTSVTLMKVIAVPTASGAVRGTRRERLDLYTSSGTEVSAEQLLQADTGLPAGWEVRHSNSKNLPYFFNASSKESRWEPPEGTDVDKLKVYMAQNTRKPEGKIHAAHLLVKHRDSRRPGSWKEPTITRTKEEAIGILKGHERRIQSGEISLGDLAQTESDCSSARKNGDLGMFGRGEMQKEFEEVAFALEPGQVSGVVDTASGVHLIQR